MAFLHAGYVPLHGSNSNRRLLLSLAALSLLAVAAVTMLARSARSSPVLLEEDEQEDPSNPLWAAHTAFVTAVDCNLRYGVFSNIFCQKTKVALPTFGDETSSEQAIASPQAKIAEVVKGLFHIDNEFNLKNSLFMKGPIDCACCKSQCKKRGIIRGKVDGKPVITKYWCLARNPLHPSQHCPVHDYNCNCCETVRVAHKGERC